jgi:hypothetical protein
MPVREVLCAAVNGRAKYRWGVAWVAAVALTCAVPASASALEFLQPPGSPYGFGSSEISDLATGDLNKDGRSDVVTAAWGGIVGGEPAYSAMLGNADGSLSPAPGGPVVLATSPLRVALGDFDNDGTADLVLVMEGNSVAVYLGNGDGSFAPTPSATLTAGLGALSVATGELDGDGLVDIAVGNFESDNVSVFYSDGDGTFTEGGGSPFAVGAEEPFSVAIGDLTGDGRGDIATANRGTNASGENAISVLVANPSGFYTSAPGSPLTGEYQSSAIAMGQVDSSASIDLVTASMPNNGVVVKRGGGDGTFVLPPGPPATYPSHQTSALTLADFNDDGLDDVALPIGTSVGEAADNSVWVFESDSNGSLAAASGDPYSISPASFPSEIGSGDFNGDGWPDIVTGNGSDNLTVLLNNEGAEPEMVVDPLELEFGELPVGEASAGQEVTISNEGSAPLEVSNLLTAGFASSDYVLDTGTCLDESVAPGEKCTVEVTFTPSDVGVREAALTITEGEGTTVEVPLSGSGGVNPVAAISPASHDFGEEVAGEAFGGSQVFEIEDTGTTRLTVGSVKLTGADPGQFEITSNLCAGIELEPEEFCEIEVSFDPTTVGAKSASLSVASDDPASPTTAALTGTGVADADLAISPSSHDFGNVGVGSTTSWEKFVVESTGTTPVTVSSAALSGADAGEFILYDQECVGDELEPGESCEIEVEFEPESAGAKSASLDIGSDAPGSPTSAALTGTGLANADLAISPTSHDFGNAAVGVETNSGQVFTLESTGTTPVTINSLNIVGADSGDFLILEEDCYTEELEPGETCELEVGFEPSSTGAKSATLNVGSDAPGSPTSAALSGNGVANPAISVEPASLDFGSRTVGEGPGPGQTVTVESTGTTPLNLVDVALTGPGAGQFQIVSGNCAGAELEAAESCQVSVAFVPTATGAHAATLEISSDAPGAPATVALSGTGLAKPASGGPGPVTVTPPPPTCLPAEVTELAPYQPKSKQTPSTTGVRARFTTDGPATVKVTAALTFKAGGKSRTVSLGQSRLNVKGTSANYKAAIPKGLRDTLPLGTKVTLKISYRSKSSASACSSFGAVEGKSLATRVVWIQR